MKRNLSTVYSNTRSKRPRLLQPLYSDNINDYITATSTYNYMVKDTLVDWLKLSSRPRSRSSSIVQVLVQKIMKPSKIIYWKKVIYLRKA